MFLDKEVVRGRMSLEKIVELVFTSTVSYREIALELLSWIKEKAAQDGRPDPWVTRAELSSFIDERFGRNRRSAAYKVLREFLLPMGLVALDKSQGRYYLSREFSRVLRRMAEAYEAWLTYK
ncbi:MAG: hypothetical protein N3H31_03505 [Candidatus Nezhaarchaeota archaeon]|nr:hypothetical protein [Candidatus Nezhaarchaeota archaeon]